MSGGYWDDDQFNAEKMVCALKPDGTRKAHRRGVARESGGSRGVVRERGGCTVARYRPGTLPPSRHLGTGPALCRQAVLLMLQKDGYNPVHGQSWPRRRQVHLAQMDIVPRSVLDAWNRMTSH